MAIWPFTSEWYIASKKLQGQRRSSVNTNNVHYMKHVTVWLRLLLFSKILLFSDNASNCVFFWEIIITNNWSLRKGERSRFNFIYFCVRNEYTIGVCVRTRKYFPRITAPHSSHLWKNLCILVFSGKKRASRKVQNRGYRDEPWSPTSWRKTAQCNIQNMPSIAISV